jgi:hypothetical protein
MGDGQQVATTADVIGLGSYNGPSARNHGIFCRGTQTFIAQVAAACQKLENYATGRAILSAVDAIDPDTLEITIRQTAGENYCYAGRWTKDFQYMSRADAADPDNQAVFGQIQTAQNNVQATGGVRDGVTKPAPTSNGTASGSTVYWNPTLYADLRDPAIALAHELCHALHNSQGQNLSAYPYNYTDKNGNQKTDNMEETWAIGLVPFDSETLCENALRKDWGLKVRKNHGRLTDDT